MASYNKTKLHELIRQHRELLASIRTFSDIREHTRSNRMRTSSLLKQAESKCWKSTELKELKPLSKLPIHEVLEAFEGHPVSAYVVRQNVIDFIESVEDDDHGRDHRCDLTIDDNGLGTVSIHGRHVGACLGVFRDI